MFGRGHERQVKILEKEAVQPAGGPKGHTGQGGGRPLAEDPARKTTNAEREQQ